MTTATTEAAAPAAASRLPAIAEDITEYGLLVRSGDVVCASVNRPEVDRLAETIPGAEVVSRRIIRSVWVSSPYRCRGCGSERRGWHKFDCPTTTD